MLPLGECGGTERGYKIWDVLGDFLEIFKYRWGLAYAANVHFSFSPSKYDQGGLLLDIYTDILTITFVLQRPDPLYKTYIEYPIFHGELSRSQEFVISMWFSISIVIL